MTNDNGDESAEREKANEQVQDLLVSILLVLILSSSTLHTRSSCNEILWSNQRKQWTKNLWQNCSVCFAHAERKKATERKISEFETNEQWAMNRGHSSFGNNGGTEITGNAKKYAIQLLYVFLHFSCGSRSTSRFLSPKSCIINLKRCFFFFCLCLSIVLRLFLCNIHQSMRAKNTQRSYCALHSKNQQGKKWLQTLVRTNQNIRFFCLNLFSRNDKATLYCSKTNISFGCTKL